MKLPHSFIAVAALLVMAFTNARTSEADTVELKTGQRIDGDLKSVTSTNVLLDVAGQLLTIARAKVNAIYYGALPLTTSPAATMSLGVKLHAIEQAREEGYEHFAKY